MTYVLEIRNTQRWEDCRYRAYTTSKKKADEFMAKVTKIKFTDSGHGLVPPVNEVPRRKDDSIGTLSDHVRECLASLA
jgi:hypothetical protein